MKKSFGITACYSFAFLACALLTLNCAKVAVTPTRYVSSSTKHLDRHINAVLKRKDIQPSGTSEDAEFLRRVHLDLIGKIPTPEEVLDFLNDGSPSKRQKKLINYSEANHTLNIGAGCG